MKQPFPPCPRGPYTIGTIGTVPRILDAKGRDVMTQPGGMDRLVECANALPKVWYPANHVAALEERCERLEQLRKDAWARAKELEAELEALRSPVSITLMPTLNTEGNFEIKAETAA